MRSYLIVVALAMVSSHVLAIPAGDGFLGTTLYDRDVGFNDQRFLNVDRDDRLVRDFASRNDFNSRDLDVNARARLDLDNRRVSDRRFASDLIDDREARFADRNSNELDRLRDDYLDKQYSNIEYKSKNYGNLEVNKDGYGKFSTNRDIEADRRANARADDRVFDVRRNNLFDRDTRVDDRLNVDARLNERSRFDERDSRRRFNDLDDRRVDFHDDNRFRAYDNRARRGEELRGYDNRLGLRGDELRGYDNRGLRGEELRGYDNRLGLRGDELLRGNFEGDLRVGGIAAVGGVVERDARPF